MKMKDVEPTDLGEDIGDGIDIYFYIGEQSEIDAGQYPEIQVSLDGLRYSLDDMIEAGSAALFVVDFYELITEDIHSPESADIVAEWIESWAEDIRKQFNAPKKKTTRPRKFKPRSTRKRYTKILRLMGKSQEP